MMVLAKMMRGPEFARFCTGSTGSVGPFKITLLRAIPTIASSPLKGSIGQTYNKIGILQKSILAVYGTWGALGGCKILPQGVGIICPLAEAFFKNVFSGEMSSYFCKKRCSEKSTYVCMYRSKGYYQNDRMVREKRLRFQGKFSFWWRNVTNKIPEVDFPLSKLPCN